MGSRGAGAAKLWGKGHPGDNPIQESGLLGGTGAD